MKIIENLTDAELSLALKDIKYVRENGKYMEDSPIRKLSLKCSEEVGIYDSISLQHTETLVLMEIATRWDRY